MTRNIYTHAFTKTIGAHNGSRAAEELFSRMKAAESDIAQLDRRSPGERNLADEVAYARHALGSSLKRYSRREAHRRSGRALLGTFSILGV
jgi:hypothetical protein